MSFKFRHCDWLGVFCKKIWRLDNLFMEHVLGGEAHFLVTFSLEVNDGLLATNLPSHLINTTELKHRNNYQWQPLQTYVTISKHFMVKASGIRFQGTVNDCNTVMQQLYYHVSHVLLPWDLWSNHLFSICSHMACSRSTTICLHSLCPK